MAGPSASPSECNSSASSGRERISPARRVGIDRRKAGPVPRRSCSLNTLQHPPRRCPGSTPPARRQGLDVLPRRGQSAPGNGIRHMTSAFEGACEVALKRDRNNPAGSGVADARRPGEGAVRQSRPSKQAHSAVGGLACPLHSGTHWIARRAQPGVQVGNPPDCMRDFSWPRRVFCTIPGAARRSVAGRSRDRRAGVPHDFADHLTGGHDLAD